MESQRGSVALSESLTTFRTTDSSVSSSTPGCQCPPPPRLCSPSSVIKDRTGGRKNAKHGQSHASTFHACLRARKEHFKKERQEKKRSCAPAVQPAAGLWREAAAGGVLAIHSHWPSETAVFPSIQPAES